MIQNLHLDQFINQNAESPQVCVLAMASLKYNLWSNILSCTTETVGSGRCLEEDAGRVIVRIRENWDWFMAHPTQWSHITGQNGE